MSISYGIQRNQAELQLTALHPDTGEKITQDLQWHLSAAQGGQSVAHSNDAQPIFITGPGTYQLTVSHGEHQIEVQNIQLKIHTRTDQMIFIPNQKDPNNYYIDEEDIFNQFTENQRRILERKGQTKFGLASGSLSEPISPQEARDLQAAMAQQGIGPNAHPILQTPQFDGIDPQVNPKPDENSQLQAELQHQLQLGMQPGHVAVPKPPV